MTLRATIVLTAVAGCFAWGGLAAAEKYPRAWRKSMTDSPNSNFPLATFAVPLPQRIDEGARNLTLIRVLGQTCEGAHVDEAAVAAYIGHSGLGAVSAQRLVEISGRTSTRFAGFDYETLAHLCAGIDYLYGPSGALAPGVMTPGSGEPNFPFDPANPILKIKPLVDGAE